MDSNGGDASSGEPDGVDVAEQTGADAGRRAVGRAVERGVTSRRAVLAGAAMAATAGCVAGESGPDCGDPTQTATVGRQQPPAVGPADAPVTVAVWEDFSCPHCGTFALEVTPQLRSEYVDDGRVRFVRHDFPIPVEQWAWPAASAARAVLAEADGDAALTFGETVYEQQTYDGGVAADAAAAAGVEPCRAIAAGSADRYRPAVERDRQRGSDRGVEGTPAVFVGDSRVEFEGEIAFDPVRAAIERAL